MKTDLLRKILFASGAAFSIVGLIVLLFSNRTVGAILIIVGFSDLAFSYYLPKIIERQSGSQDRP